MRIGRRRHEASQRQLVERLERISALVYALLHDLAAWLSRTAGPVDPAVYTEYRLEGVAHLPSPRERMARYVHALVLARWEPVLDGWLACGYGYRPSFGRSLRLAVTEGDPDGPRAVVHFQDRSEIEIPGGMRCSPAEQWTLSIRLSPDGRQIVRAALHPRAGTEAR